MFGVTYLSPLLKCNEDFELKTAGDQIPPPEVVNRFKNLSYASSPNEEKARGVKVQWQELTKAHAQHDQT